MKKEVIRLKLEKPGSRPLSMEYELRLGGSLAMVRAANKMYSLAQQGWQLTEVDGEGYVADLLRTQIQVHNDDPDHYQISPGALLGDASRASGVPVDRIKGRVKKTLKRIGVQLE